MGSKLIWIAASFVYGAVSAAIYVFACWRGKKRHLLRRGVLSFAAYTAVTLMLVRVVWLLFKN